MAHTNQNSSVEVASAKPKKSRNIIATIAPFLCLLAGYCIWRYLIGSPSNFVRPDPELASNPLKFWPDMQGSKTAISRMYLGGIIVPILIGTFLTAFVFVIERLLTVTKAKGNGNIGEFIRTVQICLADKDIEKAIVACDKQKGSVGNVMKSGLLRYRAMIDDKALTTEQKVATIQKEVEETTALELPMLEKNLVFLSTIASVATLIGLLGTVVGMIRAFSALGESGGGEAAQKLSEGISEALYNTALGIGTSAVAIVCYNIFTTRIDAITFGIDECGFTLSQSFVAHYK